MKFQVRELRRAQADVRHIVEYLAERSPAGARAWLDAYDGIIDRLETSADLFAFADENDRFEFDVHQALFKTRRGRVYRALFFIKENDAFILRVRGPGQAPIGPDDLV